MSNVSKLDCGCMVKIEDDELHVHPCGPGHETALTAAARDMATQLGVPLEIQDSEE